VRSQAGIDDKDPKKPKYKYVKVIVNDPFNNRDIIAKEAKKQKPTLNGLNPN